MKKIILASLSVVLLASYTPHIRAVAGHHSIIHAPHPADDIVNIAWESSGEFALDVVDHAGVNHLALSGFGNSAAFDRRNLSSGLYSIQITIDGKVAIHSILTVQ